MPSLVKHFRIIIFKVGPMDGGTDNGFTFTSPNWPSDPTEKIFRITSNMPNHPANSFYYPDLNDLPPIATFFFVKVIKTFIFIFILKKR